MRIIYQYIVIALAITFSSSGLYGQRSAPKIDTLFVQVNSHNQLFLKHVLKRSETLYSLASYFKVSVEDLLLINKIENVDNVAVGTAITIPVNKNKILTSVSKEERSWKPIVYKVKKRETLYKLSNLYFPQKMENLIARNNINSFSLKEGQALITGWWGKNKDADELTNKLKKKLAIQDNSKSESKKKVDNPTQTSTKPSSSRKKFLEQRKKQLERLMKEIAEEEKSIEEEKKNSKSKDKDVLKIDKIISVEVDSMLTEDGPFEEEPFEHEPTDLDTLTQEPEERKINYQSGIALWDKEGHDRENLFVMHNKAKPDSFIRLRYGVTGQEVTARVLCPMPSGLYADDIDIIISPGVALALGALDSRFQIQMDYYE